MVEPWSSIYKEYSSSSTFALAKKYNVKAPLIEAFMSACATAALNRKPLPENASRLKYEINWEAVKQAFLSGVPKPDITLFYGPGYEKINKYLAQIGLNSKNPKANRDYTPIIAAYKEGASTMELQKLFNVNSSSILRALRKAGIKIRSRAEVCKIAWRKRQRFGLKNPGPKLNRNILMAHL